MEQTYSRNTDEKNQGNMEAKAISSETANANASDSTRCYIAIDLKSFYASVECAERGLDPMTTKLVVADESRTDKTICLAVSPALKAYGIPGRARLFEVKQKLRQVKASTGEDVEFLIAPPRMAKYIAVSSDIYAIYLKYVSPEDIHVYSIDECFMDVTNYLSLYGMRAHQLAVAIIRDVLHKTGITATAGIGSNLYLSKIAMDIVAKHTEADEDGVRIAELDEMKYRRLLWDHKPLTDFWRIGHGIAKRLEASGMMTMGDVARMSIADEDKLYQMFGIDAEILIDHAWGYEPCLMQDIKNYKPQTNSISSGQVLATPYEYDKVRIIVREMIELLVLDLVEKQMVTDTMTLTLGYDRTCTDNGSYAGEVVTDYYGRSVPKSAHGTANWTGKTNSTKKIMEEMINLFDRIADKNLLYRRVTMSANNLTKEGYEQLNLFTDYEALKKEKKLQQAMLSIQKKYGKNAILKGTNLKEGATTITRNTQIGGHNA